MTSIRDTESAEGPSFGRQLKITYSTSHQHVVAWFEHHGHRGWYGGHHRVGVDAEPVVMFDHGPGTEVRAARLGDTLTVRDNGTIAVS